MAEYAALRGALAAIGPFFTVETHAPGQAASPPWQAMTVLVDGSAVLQARVLAVREALARRNSRQPADVSIRVAASVTHLGLTARLLSPAIAAIALGHPPISMALKDLWWQDRLEGPVPLSVTSGSPGPLLPGSAVEAITDAVADRFSVSDRVLWGNVGSAANSSAQLIGIARPELAESAKALADSVLADCRVDGGVLRAGPDFRRRSCCLIYRLDDNRSAVCGDCVLG